MEALSPKLNPPPSRQSPHTIQRHLRACRNRKCNPVGQYLHPPARLAHPNCAELRGRMNLINGNMGAHGRPAFLAGNRRAGRTGFMMFAPRLFRATQSGSR